MKRLVFALALVSATAYATDVEQCVQEHFKRARQYPTIKYERDRGIVRIWCGCMDVQKKGGASERVWLWNHALPLLINP